MKCKESRENSVAAGIRKFADTPMLFAQRTQPIGKPFIIIPRVSSQRRKYVPMGFLDGNTIVTDLVQIVPDASIFEFGVLTSNVHMAWMRAVCSRMKSDYRYLKDIFCIFQMYFRSDLCNIITGLGRLGYENLKLIIQFV